MSDADSTKTADARAQLDYTVIPSQLLDILQHLLSTRTPSGQPKQQAAAMIWGAMGLGKTDITRQLAMLWGCRVVSLHLPQYDPTDLKGVPVMGGDRFIRDDKGEVIGEFDSYGQVKWIASSYLPQCIDYDVPADTEEKIFNFDWPSAQDVMVHIYDADGNDLCRVNDQMNGDHNEGDKFDVDIDVLNGRVTIRGPLKRGMKIHVIDKAIIFLDELSAAVPEVQNAALQLVLDKRVGEYDVPPMTPMVAAGNRESDQAFVSPMSMPLCNRFIHLRLTESLEDWTEWAISNRVDPSIIGYLQWKKDRLFRFEPDTITEGDCGFPTPRSWAKLSEQMAGIDELPDFVGNAIITGAVGTAVGNEFIAHRKIADQLPSTDDILQGKDVSMPHDLNVGGRWHLGMGLCYAIADYHKKYYDEAIGSDNENRNQPKEWQTAAKAFCDFSHTQLGKEMTVLNIDIISRHLGLSFVHFRHPEFEPFADEYRHILRKTV